MKRRLVLGLAMTAVPFLVDTNAYCLPEGFADSTFAQAQKQANSKGKLLVVDFTASWCGPCHMMDKTTWSDPTIKKWVAENAVAIQVDVDKDRQVALGNRIEAMPTVIIFDKSDPAKEVDRQLGYQPPAELLSWLNAVMKGETSRVGLDKQLASVIGKGGPAEAKARYLHAEQAVHGGDFDAATKELDWLWLNIPKEDPAMMGVRLSYMANTMQNLAARSPAAREKFTKLRDQAKQTDIGDWICLNTVVGQDDKTLAWVDSIKNDSQLRNKLDAGSRFNLRELLIDKKRFGDASLFYVDPIVELEQMHELQMQTAAAMKKHGVTEVPDIFAEESAQMYACFLAAGKKDDAEKIKQDILTFDNSGLMKARLEAVAKDVQPPKKP